MMVPGSGHISVCLLQFAKLVLATKCSRNSYHCSEFVGLEFDIRILCQVSAQEIGYQGDYGIPQSPSIAVKS